MPKKILELVRGTEVLWIFDEGAQYKYDEATLIYDVTHVRCLTGETYEIRNGNKTVCLQFGVKKITEKWR